MYRLAVLITHESSSANPLKATAYFCLPRERNLSMPRRQMLALERRNVHLARFRRLLTFYLPRLSSFRQLTSSEVLRRTRKPSAQLPEELLVRLRGRLSIS